jgi:hypothetical protein
VGLPFARLFSMGALDGLRSLRLQRLESPDIDGASAVELISAIDPDASALDFEAALELDLLVGPSAPLEVPHEFYRACISEIILSGSASWIRTVTLGSARLLKQLSRDERQCFRAARLVESELSDDVVEWWDMVASDARSAADKVRMRRARIAERLTYERELKRVVSLGISSLPRWIAIEDNTAGYDVLSYDLGDFGPINRLIEVKSTIASPLRFYLTRHEWDHASRFKTAYYFHVWNLAAEPAYLFEITVEEVAAHIPADKGRGRWSNVEIPVS